MLKAAVCHHSGVGLRFCQGWYSGLEPFGYLGLGCVTVWLTLVLSSIPGGWSASQAASSVDKAEKIEHPSKDPQEELLR